MSPDEKLTKAVPHVVHDYVCLVSAGTSIYTNPRPPINSHVQYSFLLFCRKFHHFFMNHRSRSGMQDMAVRDFVGKKVKFKLPTWQKWDAHMVKHLFHLSYDRLANRTPWTGYTENGQILDEFRAAWRLFLENLPVALRTVFNEEIAKKLAQSDFHGLTLG